MQLESSIMQMYSDHPAFVLPLDDVASKSLTRSLDAIHALESQLRRILVQEWSAFTFLEPLRTFTKHQERLED